MKLTHLTLSAVLSCAALQTSFALPKETISKVSAKPVIWQAASGRQQIKALKVAEADGLRKMAEKIQGFHITGYGTVENLLHADSKSKTSINVFLRGAHKLGKPVYKNDGRVIVEYGVAINKVVKEINELIEQRGDKKVKVTVEQFVNQNRLVRSIGNGALDKSLGLKRIRAKRIAELDAYSNMAKRILGVKLNSNTTVRDLALKSDRIQNSICATLKGLNLTAVNYGDKTCEVTVQLKVRRVIETLTTIARKHEAWFKADEEVIKKSLDSIDDIYSVTGTGAYADEKTKTSVTTSYDQEKIILRRVISTEVIAE